MASTKRSHVELTTSAFGKSWRTLLKMARTSCAVVGGPVLSAAT
jgi:hypothetical protein